MARDDGWGFLSIYGWEWVATADTDASERFCEMSDMKQETERYYDTDGQECSLDMLCRSEPEWARNVILHLKKKLAEAEAERDGWRERLKRIDRLVARCNKMLLAICHQAYGRPWTRQIFEDEPGVFVDEK